MMNNSIRAFRNKRVYFSGLLSLLVTGSCLLISLGPSALFISLNSPHPFWLNVFFINFTFMGDGIFAISLVAFYFFYFKKRNQGLALLYALLLSAIIVQLIKNLFNSTEVTIFFEHGQYMFFTEAVTIPDHPGFPSGHTAIAFTIATLLVLFARSKKWQLPGLLAASLVGFSRIYLAQHFLVDILAGALTGVCSAMTAYILVTRKFKVPAFNNTKKDFHPAKNIVYG